MALNKYKENSILAQFHSNLSLNKYNIIIIIRLFLENEKLLN